MLTEGWDTNTVTHILGVRAFGTQLLCEQVVGRGLRRQSYDLNEERPVRRRICRHPWHSRSTSPPSLWSRTAEPRRSRSRACMPSRSARRSRSSSRASTAIARICRRRAHRSQLHRGQPAELTPEIVGPCTVVLEGIVGEGVDDHARGAGAAPAVEISFISPSICSTRASAIRGRLPEAASVRANQAPRAPLARRGLSRRQGRARSARSPIRTSSRDAAERIYLACHARQRGRERIKAMLDPYNPRARRATSTSSPPRTLWKTGAQPPSATSTTWCCDSDWEAELAPRRSKAIRACSPTSRTRHAASKCPIATAAITAALHARFRRPVDDGRDDPLNLVLEIKGYRGGDAQGQGRDHAQSLGARREQSRHLRPLGFRGVHAMCSRSRSDFAALVEMQLHQERYRLMARDANDRQRQASKQVEALDARRGHAPQHPDRGNRTASSERTRNPRRAAEALSARPPLAEGETRERDEDRRPADDLERRAHRHHREQMTAAGGDGRGRARRRATRLARQGPAGLVRPRRQRAAALHPGEGPPQGDHRRSERRTRRRREADRTTRPTCSPISTASTTRKRRPSSTSTTSTGRTA